MKININKNQEGIRLDKFLYSKYKNSNIIDIQKFIKKKDIKINDKKIDVKYILKENDIITFNDFIEKILLNPDKTTIKKNKNISEKYNNLITNNIIYEDENLFVINKVSGLSVQGGSGIDVSIDKILKNLNTIDTNLKLVHRLDKDTSGVLIIAKNIEAANALTEIFKNRKNIKKEYLLFTFGKPTINNGIIDLPLIKKYNNNVEKVYVDKVNGKKAITKYELINYSERYNISLIKANILTGRTHQIRVHFKEIGCPVLGDFKYGNGNKVNIDIGKNLFLHSWRISLDLFGKDYEFVADLPKYMEDLKNKLNFDF